MRTTGQTAFKGIGRGVRVVERGGHGAGGKADLGDRVQDARLFLIRQIRIADHGATEDLVGRACVLAVVQMIVHVARDHDVRILVADVFELGVDPDLLILPLERENPVKAGAVVVGREDVVGIPAADPVAVVVNVACGHELVGHQVVAGFGEIAEEELGAVLNRHRGAGLRTFEDRRVMAEVLDVNDRERAVGKVEIAVAHVLVVVFAVPDARTHGKTAGFTDHDLFGHGDAK